MSYQWTMAALDAKLVVMHAYMIKWVTPIALCTLLCGIAQAEEPPAGPGGTPKPSQPKTNARRTAANTRHVLRIDGVAGWPVPIPVPDLGARFTYAFFPFSRISLEATAMVSLMGEHVGLGVRVHPWRHYFFAVRETALFATSIAHDAFGGPRYPGYLVSVDIFGYENRRENGSVFQVSLGTTTVIHSFAHSDKLFGFTAPQLTIGWGKWY